MTVEASDARPRGLDSAGLAAAATMASLCVGLVVLGAVVPHLGVLQLAAVVPFGVVAHRHGLRALIASLAAAAFVAALVIGLGGAIALALFAGLGGLVGELKRHGRGAGTACLLAAGLAPLAAGAFDLLLLAFSAYRRLVLANILSTTRGLASALDHLGPLGRAGRAIGQLGATITAHWALAAALIVIIALPLAARQLDPDRRGARPPAVGAHRHPLERRPQPGRSRAAGAAAGLAARRLCRLRGDPRPQRHRPADRRR